MVLLFILWSILSVQYVLRSVLFEVWYITKSKISFWRNEVRGDFVTLIKSGLMAWLDVDRRGKG